jgi:ECF transporter S component (folate family)
MSIASAVTKEPLLFGTVYQRERSITVFKQTRTLVYLAVLAALSIVFGRILSVRVSLGGIEGIRIGLGGLPIILAGFAFGPWYGGVVGALSDIVGYMINPMGAYAPHFTLSAYLTGFIPGAVIWYGCKGQRKYWQLVLAVLVGELATNVGLVPYFLYTLFEIPYKPMLIPRLCSVLIQAPLYAYCAKVILNFKPLKLTDMSGQPKP